jgi:hypothetical protein
MDYGITAIGGELWAAESADGAKITDKSAYSRLTRIRSTSEMTIDQNGVDVTAIEDPVTHYAAGRSEVADTYSIEFLVTNETLAEWEALKGKKVCFLEKLPGLTKQCFIVATVPTTLPKAPMENGEAYVGTINCTTNNYIGYNEAVDVGN